MTASSSVEQPIVKKMKKSKKVAEDTAEVGAEVPKKEKKSKKRSLDEIAQAEEIVEKKMTAKKKKLNPRRRQELRELKERLAQGKPNGRGLLKGLAPEKKEKEESSADEGSEDETIAETPQKVENVAAKIVTKKDEGDIDPTKVEIFVNGLPFDWSDSDIKELFTVCGTVEEVRAPRWHDSSRLRGYCHIRFSDNAGQQAAIKKMHKYYVSETRYLDVQPAQHAKVKVHKVDPSEIPDGCKTAFVKNLPYESSEEAIALALGGKRVSEVRIVTEGRDQRPKGFAYVDFKTTEGLREAIVLASSDKGVSIRGRRLKLDYETGQKKLGFTYRNEAWGTRLGPLSNSERKHGKGKGKGKGGE